MDLKDTEVRKWEKMDASWGWIQQEDKGEGNVKGDSQVPGYHNWMGSLRQGSLKVNQFVVGLG